MAAGRGAIRVGPEAERGTHDYLRHGTHAPDRYLTASGAWVPARKATTKASSRIVGTAGTPAIVVISPKSE